MSALGQLRWCFYLKQPTTWEQSAAQFPAQRNLDRTQSCRGDCTRDPLATGLSLYPPGHLVVDCKLRALVLLPLISSASASLFELLSNFPLLFGQINAVKLEIMTKSWYAFYCIKGKTEIKMFISSICGKWLNLTISTTWALICCLKKKKKVYKYPVSQCRPLHFCLVASNNIAFTVSTPEKWNLFSLVSPIEENSFSSSSEHWSILNCCCECCGVAG